MRFHHFWLQLFIFYSNFVSQKLFICWSSDVEKTHIIMSWYHLFLIPTNAHFSPIKRIICTIGLLVLLRSQNCYKLVFFSHSSGLSRFIVFFVHQTWLFTDAHTQIKAFIMVDLKNESCPEPQVRVQIDSNCFCSFSTFFLSSTFPSFISFGLKGCCPILAHYVEPCHKDDEISIFNWIFISLGRLLRNCKVLFLISFLIDCQIDIYSIKIVMSLTKKTNKRGITLADGWSMKSSSFHNWQNCKFCNWLAYSVFFCPDDGGGVCSADYLCVCLCWDA